MKKILLSIVTYTPQIAQFKDKIKSFLNHVDFILIFDNHSSNQIEISRSFTQDNIKVVLNEKNIGLPVNYNRAIEFGQRNGFDFLLILDQDSVPDEKFFTEYKKNIADNPFCLVPLIQHVNEDYASFYPEKYTGETELVKSSINSGTLLNLNNIPENLRYDEDFFIDCVDFDFFLRLRRKHDIKRINTAILKINLGNITQKGPFFLYNYPSRRLRKQSRDRVVFFRKHLFSSFSVWFSFFILFNNIKILLFEKNRLTKAIAMIVGTFEGFKKKLHHDD